MIGTTLLALGLIFIIEGLVLALAPSFYEEILRWIAALPVETRRLIGALAITSGALLLWFAAWLGA